MVDLSGYAVEFGYSMRLWVFAVFWMFTGGGGGRGGMVDLLMIGFLIRWGEGILWRGKWRSEGRNTI